MTSNAPMAIAAYYAAEQAHDQNHLDEDGYIDALHILDDWQPATASDFVHKFIALHHDGYSPNYDRLQKLIEQARNVLAPVDFSAWTDATMAEQAAREESDAFHAEHVAPMNAAHDAGTATLEQASEQEQAWAAFTSAHADAIEALILTPAPSFQAVAHKLRLGCQDWFFDGSDQSTAALEVIATDVERLSGEA